MRRSRSVAGLVERLSHCTYGDAYRDGLKPAQWSALRYFSSANRFSRTTSAFACYQGISLSAASQTIGKLVGKRLLKRTGDKTDKRRHQLTLMARGETLMRGDPIRSLVEAACELGEADEAAVTAGLEKMLAHLMRRKGSAYFGYCENCSFLQCARRQGSSPRAYRCSHLGQDLSANDLTKICINFGPQDLCP
jgi:DNA-binding MarR family transcriptional regulator